MVRVKDRQINGPIGCDCTRRSQICSEMADGEGFEPSVPCGTHAFQACPIDRSGTHPGQAANTPAFEGWFQLLFCEGP